MSKKRIFPEDAVVIDSAPSLDNREDNRVWRARVVFQALLSLSNDIPEEEAKKQLLVALEQRVMMIGQKDD